MKNAVNILAIAIVTDFSQIERETASYLIRFSLLGTISIQAHIPPDILGGGDALVTNV